MLSITLRVRVAPELRPSTPTDSCAHQLDVQSARSENQNRNRGAQMVDSAAPAFSCVVTAHFPNVPFQLRELGSKLLRYSLVAR